MKKYMVIGLSDSCPLCIDVDGRKGPNKPLFQVVAEGGGYSGPICAMHLAALIRMEEGGKNSVPEKQPTVNKQPVTNGPAVAPVTK